MEIPAVLWVLLAVLANTPYPALAQNEVRYFQVGRGLVLKPDPVSERITSVVWKHSGNLLAEWVEGVAELEYYGSFKGRAMLNTSTGELQISKLTKGDNGVYSVEINNKVQTEGYEVVVIKEVPKPELIVRPLACSKNSINCTLSCHDEVDMAELVTYFWKLGDAEWKKSGKDLFITNDEEALRVKTYSCRMTNPVSGKDSDPIDDPFSRMGSSGDGPNVGAAVGSVVGILAVVVVVGLLFAFRDKEPIRGCFSFLPGNRGGGEGGGEGGGGQNGPSANDSKENPEEQPFKMEGREVPPGDP